MKAFFLKLVIIDIIRIAIAERAHANFEYCEIGDHDESGKQHYDS